MPWGRRISQAVQRRRNQITAGAVRWSCSRCKVSVGQLDGTRTRLPDTWTRSGDSAFCLLCSRALAGEAATESAPSTCSRQERALIHREAVIRFEIGRTPLAPNRAIALTCHTSPKKVASVREALEGVPAGLPAAAAEGP